MSEPIRKRSCVPHCTASVPQELDSTGLCVSHFTFNVERACAEMHRQIAMRGMPPDRQAEIAVYLAECALLLARVASSLSLSDVLKRRVSQHFSFSDEPARNAGALRSWRSADARVQSRGRFRRFS